MTQENSRVLITQNWETENSKFCKVLYLRTFHILIHFSLYITHFLIFPRHLLKRRKRTTAEKRKKYRGITTRVVCRETASGNFMGTLIYMMVGETFLV